MVKYECTPDLRMRLYLAREALGLSQRAMGRKMGLSNSFYGRLETKEKEISENTIITICSVFAIRSEYLLEGIPPMFDNDDVNVKGIIKRYYELSEPYKKYWVEFSQYLELKDKHEQALIHG